MEVVTIVGLVGIPLSMLALWLFDPILFRNAPALHAVVRSDPEFPIWLRLSAWAVTMIGAAPLLFGLDRLRRLFALYREGRVFVPAAARRLHAFAAAVIAMAVVQPIAGAALSVLLTIDNPPGQRQFSIAFGSGELQTLFVGVLFLVIATIMREAIRIADENAQFV
jgi:hypothetical protein